MKLEIEVDIFSGRKNPVLELEGEEAEQTLKSLEPANKLKKDQWETTASSILGYRGLIVRQRDNRLKIKKMPRSFRVVHGKLFGPGLAHIATDENFENYFFGSKGPIQKLKIGRNISNFITKEKTRSFQLSKVYKTKRIIWPTRILCKCAPIYEPEWWNDGGQKQLNNNCYNYATDYRSDTFAQPGLAAGSMYTSLSCAAVKPASVADALVDMPNANNKCTKEGHLVALVVAPGIDFHWYRKSINGFWTHKPGSTPATNLDNSGNVIPDPRTADRGPYTDFCTFMVVKHGHIKIS